MQAVFARVGKLMRGKRLTPGLLVCLSENSMDIVEGHRVTVSHKSAKELGDRHGCYAVLVTGPRIDGQWHIRSGQMEQLSRRAASAVSDMG